jgi:hypothetical protein
VVTDLLQIRRLAETDRGENLRFRRFVKEHHYPQGLLEPQALLVGLQGLKRQDRRFERASVPIERMLAVK